MLYVGNIENNIFSRFVNLIEKKFSQNANYTVLMACERIKLNPNNIQKNHIPMIIHSIVDIYREYYPEKSSEIGSYLSLSLDI